MISLIFRYFATKNLQVSATLQDCFKLSLAIFTGNSNHRRMFPTMPVAEKIIVLGGFTLNVLTSPPPEQCSNEP